MNKGNNGVSYLHEPPESGRSNQQSSRENRENRKQSLLNAIKTQSVALVLDSLGRMFDGIDDSFFELANHAHSNNEQNRYFESMREIRIRRKGIEQNLQQVLYRAFDNPKEIQQSNPDTLTDEISIDELSLVQNDALEESVAVDSMITKAKANYAGSLMHFQTRFSAFVGGSHSNKIYNPLDPSLVCKTFSELCSELEIEIKEKLIVFKQFDRHVMESLAEALEKGNQLMLSAGILPNLKYTTFKNKAPIRRSDQLTSTEDLTGELGQNPVIDNEILNQAQEMLAALRNPARHSLADIGTDRPEGLQQSFSGKPPLQSNTGFSGPSVRIDTADLATMLNRFQATMNAEDLTAGPVVPVDLRSSVQAILNEESNKAKRPTEINQIDEDLIDLVAMLFEFILDDYTLAAPIQVLISRLQIPILKIAIKDKAFFGRPSHPARKLLNSLAQASIGWSETSEKSKDKLYAKIHDIVREIIENEDSTLELYERLYTDFNLYLEKDDRKSKLVEQRTLETEVGRVKSQKARLVVDRILYDKISVTAIPQVALDILKNGWSRVMFLVYLKEGRGHRFSQCVKIVDELIWCLQPHSEEDARKRWVQIVPKLLKNLKLGLREISYNSNQLDDMLLSLKKELTNTFKQQSATVAIRDIPVLTDLKASIDAAETKPVITSDASLFEYLEKIDKLESGDWVEFSLVNGNRFRCKFSTSINENDSLIFVNRMGLKVVEKNRMELAEELRKGQLIILQAGPLMDRAIDAVMNNLRKMTDKVA